jgi:hypothetical protein
MPKPLYPALLLYVACGGTPPSQPAGPPPARDCEGTLVAAALTAVARGTADGCQRDLYLQLIMERGRHVGPWIEELWVAPSTDGRTFELEQATLVRSSGAVPDVIVHEGRTWLFYGEGDLGAAFERASQGSDWFLTRGLPGFGALGLLVSEDGLHFEPVPEFGIEGLLVGMVVDPDVIRLPDGRFRLYYVGLPVEGLTDTEAWDDDAQHDVYYAESDDLIHWRQVGLAVHGPIADPTVFCQEDGHCRMFSTGMDHAHSDDGGASFVFDGATRLRGFAPELLRIDGQLRHVYNAMIHGGPLMTRHQQDGGGWSEPEELVPAYRVEAPSFAPAPDGQGWLMYYHYYMEEYRHIYPARPAVDPVPDEGSAAP